MKKFDIMIHILYNIYLVLNKEELEFIFKGQPESPNEMLTRQQVKDYLKISESTYKRKVNDGSLKPIKLPGGDRFYLKDLIAAYLESQKKGRI